jgi:hypothetical protein
MGGTLCLLLNSGRVLTPINNDIMPIISLPLLHLVIYEGLVHNKFCLMLGPLFLRMPPHHRALAYTKGSSAEKENYLITVPTTDI